MNCFACLLLNSRMKIIAAFLLATLCLGSAQCATNQALRYRLQRLDEFVDHDGSADLLLNNRGQVAALVHDEDSTPHLFLRGRKRTIEVLLPIGASASLQLAALTGHGTILFRDEANDSAYHYRRGKPLNLSNALPYKYFNTVAMNNRGRIVGSAQWDLGTPITAFSYYRGRHRELGSLLLNTPSFALAVNNRGQVVGASEYQTNIGDATDYSLHAVIFKKDGVVDLGTLDGGKFSVATGINDLGTVIGYSVISQPTEDGPINYRRGFVYRDGVMEPLNPPPGHVHSRPLSINRRGQIVGYSTDKDGERRAVLLLNGQTFDLNDLIPPDSDVELRMALSINNRGVIAAIGDSGESFLLIPE